MNRGGRTLLGKSHNGEVASRWALLLALATLALLALTGTAGQERLQYDRQALQATEWWRLLSAHLVHMGTPHLLFNLGGLLLLGMLFGREYSLVRWALITLLSMAAIDAGLWYLRPQVAWYLGASGVLHGLWSAGACAQLRRRRWQTALPLGALLVKLAFEQWQGRSTLLGGLPVIIDAHVFGAFGGLAFALPQALRRKWL